MSLSTSSIVNGVHAAYQSIAHASTQGFVWLKGASVVAFNSATKAALVAKSFFAQAVSQGYSVGKTYAAVGFQLAKANRFVSGIVIGASAATALHLLVAKFRAPAQD